MALTQNLAIQPRKQFLAKFCRAWRSLWKILKMDPPFKKKICIRSWYTNLPETCKPSSLSASFTTRCTNICVWKDSNDAEMRSSQSINASWKRVDLSLTRRWTYKNSFIVSVFKRQLYFRCLREDSVTLWIRWVISPCKNPQSLSTVVVMTSSIWLIRNHLTTTSKKWLKVQTRLISASLNSTWFKKHIGKGFLWVVNK